MYPNELTNWITLTGYWNKLLGIALPVWETA